MESAKYHVAVVGQLGANRLLVGERLKGLSCHAQEFEKAQDALEHMESFGFNFVVVISQLPDMHWLTFIRTLRARENTVDLNIVLITTADVILDETTQALLTKYQVKHKTRFPIAADFFRVVFNELIASPSSKAAALKRLQEAKALYRKGLAATARRIFQEVVDAESGNLVARAALAFSEKFDNREAYLKQLNILLASDPENYNYRFELMQHHVANHEFNRFREIFDEVMQELEGATEMYWLRQLGDICLTLNLASFCDRIIALMDKLSDKIEAWQPIMLRARVELANGKVNEALLTAMRALQVSGDQAEVLNILGIILRKLSRLDEAMDYFKRAREATPRDHRILYNIALCYRDMNQPRQVLSSLEQALELCPTYRKATELKNRMVG